MLARDEPEHISFARRVKDTTGYKTRPHLDFRITEIYVYRKCFLYIALFNMRK